MNRNSNKLFLRNEFLKIFEDLSTLKLFTKMPQIWRIKNKSLRLKFDVDGIFELIKMFSRKFPKLNEILESHPTAWLLKSIKF